jgi:predicted RNA-binding protein with TRAM domain
MREPEDKARELFEEVERRAFMELPDDDDENNDVDVIAALRAPGGAEVDASELDMTLGGYVAKHTRPPAFGGLDGQPYTVDVDTEATGGDGARAFAAFLVFLRWAETGAGIMEHTESGDVAFGATEAEARNRALELTLFEVKAELDAAIERKRKDLEG